MKIKAYTLLEVTIAMLLSAICIGICYSAYDIVGKYYAAFQQKNESAEVLLSMRQVMDKDLSKAGLVLKTSEGILCKGDSSSISYLFEDGRILRKMEGLRTDTFKVVWKELYVGFEGEEVLEADTLDLVMFKLTLNKQTIVPLSFSKNYSAHNLFH